MCLTHVTALDKREIRKRYVVGSENVLVKDIGGLVKKLSGVKPLHWSMPRGFTLVLASLVEWVPIVIGIQPLFTRDLVYEVSKRYGFYDCTETNETFGIKPRYAEACLQESMARLVKTAHIK